MGKKGYISEFMGGGRIVSHGKIADKGLQATERKPVLGLCQTEVQRINS